MGEETGGGGGCVRGKGIKIIMGEAVCAAMAGR